MENASVGKHLLFLLENQSAGESKKSKNRGVSYTTSSTPSFFRLLRWLQWRARPPRLASCVALAQANPE
jgi:hypothetical protein